MPGRHPPTTPRATKRPAARTSAADPQRRPIRSGHGQATCVATGPIWSATCWSGWPTTYGPPAWEPRLDPTSELILTILTQNTADVNAEKAFEALRAAYPSDLAPEEHRPGIGLGR